MARSKFKVFGVFGKPSEREATVIIDRAAGLFTVRPKRRHKFYELPLGVVAEMVLCRVVRAELAEKKREKKRKRHGLV